MHHFIRAAALVAGFLITATAAEAACKLSQITDEQAMYALQRELASEELTRLTHARQTDVGRMTVWFRVSCDSSMETLRIARVASAQGELWREGDLVTLNRMFMFDAASLDLLGFEPTGEPTYDFTAEPTEVGNGDILRVRTFRDGEHPRILPADLEGIDNAHGKGTIDFEGPDGSIFRHDVLWPPL